MKNPPENGLKRSRRIVVEVRVVNGKKGSNPRFEVAALGTRIT
jgi:hypothetical protein